ncbi:MAG: major facilitator superfamily protein [Rubritepida sp.]|nr:major facilitator superfamily protein [Rubritepida sp.]
MSSINLKAPRSGVPPRAMTVFGALALATILAGSTAPTPLYRLYQEQWGFPHVTLTLIFAVYALSLLAALLTVGSLSDHVGRRPVIFASLVTSALAMWIFVHAGSPEALIAARIVQGFSAGAAASTIGAALMDADRARGPLINSVAPFSGMTVGALGASALASFAPAPTQLVFLILLGAFAVLSVAVWWMPETGMRRPGAWASLPPHILVPPHAKGPLLAITPVNVAAWSFGGFYLSLVPSLVRATTGLTSPLVGGVVVATLTLSAAGAVLLFRGWAPDRNLATGAWALILGVATTLLGAQLSLVPLMMAGAVFSGAGLGASFFGASRTIMPLAGPRERAGLLAAFYVQCYLAFSLPAILAGLATPHLGLTATAQIYGAAVILLATVSLVATRVLRPATARG